MIEPILLEFELPKNGLIVVGDLHGNLYVLLKVFEKYGLPPMTNYIFLGKVNAAIRLIYLKNSLKPSLFYA